MKTEISLYDLEGTVEEAIQMLETYPKDATISVDSERVYGYGGWTNETRDFLVVEYKKKHKKES